MANEILSSDFHFYQSANAQADRVKENFLVRMNEFEIIMDDIRRQPVTGSVQHFLLIGRRGSGKSTLLKRLQIEIESSPELARKFIAINLAEEQANIYKLYDLLEAVLDELDYNNVKVNIPAWDDDNNSYSRKLFAGVHRALEVSGRKMVLLLDNIDRIFENLQEEASLLREYLLNYDDLKIVGGSTKMTEHFWKYNKPFYEFFRVLELKPLTSDEIKCLMINWSEKLNLPELAEFAKNKPGQLETMRILTDGLPRTLQFFVNILLTRTQETGYEYLRLIMDNVTPLYQERLNSLPPSQRKIVLQLAFLWETVGAKELSETTKMDTKIISAQLKQLTEKGITDKITTVTKNHLYRLSERFFNLWLIFTQGSPKEKRRAKCLTVFLENFYDAEEIMKMATDHIITLKEGKPAANKAALLTKALAQSKYINFYIRDQLIDNTMELQNMAEELRHQLPLTTKQIQEEVHGALLKKDYKKAIKIAQSIEQDDGYRELLMGYINNVSNNYIEAANFLHKSFEKGFQSSAQMLAKVYEELGETEAAEKYFLKAVELGMKGSHFELAEFYANQDRDDQAVKYYKEAIDKEEWEASYKLGRHYFINDDNKLAEEYHTIGIEHEVQGSAISLAAVYYFQNINREKVPGLIALEKSWVQNKKIVRLQIFEIILDVWLGNFENLEARIIECLSKKEWKDASLFITLLLVHNQLNLVSKLFLNPSFGAELKETFLPLYYATTVLSNKEDNSSLKIPPELKETVEKVLTQVHSLAQLYK